MKRPAQSRVKNLEGRVKNKKRNSFFKSLIRFYAIVPVLLICLFAYLLIPIRAHAASGINKQINFQGKLVDNNGLNVADSTYIVVFSLYTTSSGGSAAWTESDSVSTLNGVFQVALGATTAFPGNVDFNSDTWYLGIKVGSDAEMTPRVRFSAVPYAFNAAALDGIVATNSATQFTITGGTNALIDLTVNGSLTLGSTIRPTAAGGLTVQSNGANGLTLDTGGAATLAIGATANNITFGATNNPTYAFNGTGTVTFQGTSFTLGNGSAATIQTTSNAGLNLLSAGSGNITLGQNIGNGGIIVSPNAGGNAALIINKQADLGAINPNLFVASSAGVLKFAVDSGGNATAAGSLSVGQPSSAFTNAVGNFSGNVNNFLQVQVQNKSNGNSASTDFIATADNGTDTTNYIDVGINGSGYNQATFNIGGPDDGYLYTSNGALTIGTASNKPLIFHTNGTTSSNEALRIDALGKISAGTVGTNGVGNGQLVINQTNNSGLGDIFSASAAAVTEFTIKNDGTIKAAKYGTQNGVLYVSATDGTVSETAASTGIQCLQTASAGSAPIWGACAGGGATLQSAYNSGQTIDLSQAGTGLSIGTNTGTQNIVFAPNAGGQAALVINKQGPNGDIFTASASGTTKLVLSSAGNLGIGTSAPQEELTLGSAANFVGEMAVPAGASATAVSGGTLVHANYFYKVTATDGIGETVGSTETGVCTSTGATNTCNVSWNSVVGAVLYKIYRTSTSGSYTGTNFLTSVTGTSFSDTGAVTLTSGTPPSATTAYVSKLSFFGNSWILGGSVGLGTTSPLATLHVKGGNTGGNAAFIVDQIGAATNDILTGSASGSTKFIVHNDGSIQTAGANATADITTITGGNGLTILPKANTSGAGGGLTLKGGNGTGAAGGNVNIDAGTGLTNGTISIGTSNQSGLTLGRSGATSTLNGSSITLGAATGVSGALTITSSASTALTVGANGSTNPVLQVDASTGSVATGLKVLGAATGGTTAVSVIDSGANANLSIDAKGSGTITIGGTSTGSIILGGPTNGLTFSTTSGPSYAGTGRPTRQIILSAEYAGAVLTASGSAAITGNMTSDASPSAVTTTANNYENYYMWTATALGADQQYTVAVRVTLPKDFSDWATGNAITVDFNTPFTNSALNSLDVFIYKGGDTTGRAVAFSKSNVSATSKNWTQVTFTKTQLTSVAPTLTAAGQVAVFYLTFHSTNTVNYVQVGDITLNYLAGF